MTEQENTTITTESNETVTTATESEVANTTESTSNAEQTAQPPATEQKAEEAKPEVKESAKETPKTTGFERRIGQLTSEKHEERRKRQAAEALLAEVTTNTGDGKAGEGDKVLTQADVERLADIKAAQKVAADNSKRKEEAFNDVCAQVYKSGAEEYSDFDDKLKTLGLMGSVDNDFLSIVTELPQPARILHYLGDNPEEAERILALPPVKQGIELARLETKVSKAKQVTVSNAPEPINPIGGSGSSTKSFGTKYYDGMPDDEYLAYRKNIGIGAR